MGLRENLDRVMDRVEDLLSGRPQNQQPHQHFYPAQVPLALHPPGYTQAAYHQSVPSYGQYANIYPPHGYPPHGYPPHGYPPPGYPPHGYARLSNYSPFPPPHSPHAFQQPPPGYAPPVPHASKPPPNPPPVPSGSKPSARVPVSSFPSPPARPTEESRADLVGYWRPRFEPHVPVSEYFVHECGDWGWGNNELENYTDSTFNSFHSANNELIIRAFADSANSDPKKRYTSARLTSKQLLGRDSGYIEASITAPIAKGVWPAFWLLPADPFKWPTDGEVDIMELWNGDQTNHSCLHWGQHGGGEDWDKHRVVKTHISSPDKWPHLFGFAWDDGGGGRCIWYVDGQPVMRASKPPDTRPWRQFRIILNVAMGGTVCAGAVPDNGCYDMTVHDLMMCEAPPFGWRRFDRDMATTKEGSPDGS